MGMLSGGLGRLLKTGVMGTEYMDAQDERRLAAEQKALMQQLSAKAAALFNPIPGQVREIPGQLRDFGVVDDQGGDISAAFGMEQGPARMVQTPGRNRSPQELAQELAQLAAMGLPVKQFTDLMVAGKRDIKRDETGTYVDFSDPSIVGRAAPKAPDGGYIVQGENGPQTRMALGYNDAVMGTKAAETTGVEAAKAGYDLIDIPDGNGGTIKMPRSAYLGMIGSGRAGQAGGMGYTPPPEVQTYKTDAAKAQVERDFTRPKAQAALSAMDAKTKVVDDAINRVLGISVDPRTGKAVQGPSMVNGWTTGAGSVLAGIPGSPAKDLQAAIETIKANLGFDELQTMRDNSPTGGALGQVAVQELEALRSTLSSLDQAQSPQQVVASLKRIQEIRRDSAARRREAFEATYSSPSGGYQGGATGPRTTLGRSRIISVGQ